MSFIRLLGRVRSRMRSAGGRLRLSFEASKPGTFFRESHCRLSMNGLANGLITVRGSRMRPQKLLCVFAGSLRLCAKPELKSHLLQEREEPQTNPHSPSLSFIARNGLAGS